MDELKVTITVDPELQARAAREGKHPLVALSPETAAALLRLVPALQIPPECAEALHQLARLDLRLTEALTL